MARRGIADPRPARAALAPPLFYDDVAVKEMGMPVRPQLVLRSDQAAYAEKWAG
jgi:hypothetical protein